jgi:hypothetical protein
VNAAPGSHEIVTLIEWQIPLIDAVEAPKACINLLTFVLNDS